MRMQWAAPMPRPHVRGPQGRRPRGRGGLGGPSTWKKKKKVYKHTDRFGMDALGVP